MKEYTPYQERIRQCFSQAYKFLDEHKHARTQEDWNNIAKGISDYDDPFTVDLIIAVTNEIEREYKQSMEAQPMAQGG